MTLLSHFNVALPTLIHLGPNCWLGTVRSLTFLAVCRWVSEIECGSQDLEMHVVNGTQAGYWAIKQSFEILNCQRLVAQT